MTVKEKKNIHFEKGFTILELVIAMFILTFGILSVMKLFGSTIIDSRSATNEIIASDLAQEAIELIRNIRDNNLLDQRANESTYVALDRYINPATIPASGTPAPAAASRCLIDMSYVSGSARSVSCNETINQRLYLNSSNQYVHSSSSGTQTLFNRYYNVTGYQTESVNGSNVVVGMRISSRVWWGDADPATSAECTLKNKCVELNDYLPNR